MPSQKLLRERMRGEDGVAAATAAAGVGMRAVGRGDGVNDGVNDGERDGDKDGNGDGLLNGNDRWFAGRPEVTEGTDIDGTGEEGMATTPAEAAVHIERIQAVKNFFAMYAIV